MKIPVCPLCRGQKSPECFTERDFTVRQCSDCELFFISPYPSSDNQVHNRVSQYNYKEIEILDPERHYQAEVLFYDKWFPLIAEECKDAKY